VYANAALVSRKKGAWAISLFGLAMESAHSSSSPMLNVQCSMARWLDGSMLDVRWLNVQWLDGYGIIQRERSTPSPCIDASASFLEAFSQIFIQRPILPQ
jgi:hypothetical protein